MKLRKTHIASTINPKLYPPQHLNYFLTDGYSLTSIHDITDLLNGRTDNLIHVYSKLTLHLLIDGRYSSGNQTQINFGNLLEWNSPLGRNYSSGVHHFILARSMHPRTAVIHSEDVILRYIFIASFCLHIS